MIGILKRQNYKNIQTIACPHCPHCDLKLSTKKCCDNSTQNNAAKLAATSTNLLEEVLQLYKYRRGLSRVNIPCMTFPHG
jgi:hypothetical protein